MARSHVKAPVHIKLIVLILSLLSTRALVGHGAPDFISIKHRIDRGSNLSDTAKYAGLSLYRYDEYKESVGTLRSGIEYSTGQLKKDYGKGEIQIPYYIKVAKEVALGTYQFEATYYLYESDKSGSSPLTLVLRFTIEVTEPFSIGKIPFSYWLFSLTVLLTIVVGTFLVFRAKPHFAQKAKRRLPGVTAGSGLIILGCLTSAGAVLLFLHTGGHVLPPFSYYVWFGIIVIIALMFGAGVDYLYGRNPFRGRPSTSCTEGSERRCLICGEVMTPFHRCEENKFRRKVVSSSGTMKFCPFCKAYVPLDERDYRGEAKCRICGRSFHIG